jgi:NAD-dependent deacetylase
LRQSTATRDTKRRTSIQTIGFTVKSNIVKSNTTFDIPQALISALQQAKHVVVFTGAGVSAESGIATFRDALTGLWERFDIADLATPEAFQSDQELVWGWYEWRRMQVMRAQPNPAHSAIAALAQHVPKLTLITQNVDDLHERAGSVNVLHLHGTLHCPRCSVCGHTHILTAGIPAEPEGGRRLCPPPCIHCGGAVRPGVVWFDEDLPVRPLSLAFASTSECDVLLAIGTSGLVQPAASIPLLAKQAGANLAQINPMRTELDSVCTWSLCGAAGVLMPRLLDAAFPSVQGDETTF